jgi:aspartyl-tRNA(Asn)/glutamyl-tRNA(Gln) amidotransferase subunit A
MSMINGIWEQAARLARGEQTSIALVNAALAAIDKNENCASAFVLTNGEDARKAACHWDRLRQSGRDVPCFAGIPITVKDLFDLKGQRTLAGSRVLATQPPAANDAAAIARLLQMGFVIVGRTHMTEFAYSGLGLNAHFPEPRCSWDEPANRVPGGSSSGAAVATALGAGVAGIGTDTGGSCRIPAAFNHLVGFKPTAGNIPVSGMVPLAPSLDSIGSIAHGVSCVALLDTIMSGTTEPTRIKPIMPQRLIMPDNYFFENVDAVVLRRFEDALQLLEKAGVDVIRRSLPSLDAIPEITYGGGIVAAESYDYHAHRLNSHREEFDERVASRIALGIAMPPEKLSEIKILREKLISEMRSELAGVDALVAPTVPMLPPLKTACENTDEYHRLNRAVLRNPSAANLMDGCSISLPISRSAEEPVGLMLIGQGGSDQTILSTAAGIESAFQQIGYR